MDKYLLNVEDIKVEENPELERKRKPEDEIFDYSTSSTEADASSNLNTRPTRLAKSKSNFHQKKKVKRLNKFNDLWLKEPKFLSWLRKDSNMKDGNELATCLLCSVSLIAHKSDLIRHMNSQRHKKKAVQIKELSTSSSYFPLTDLEINVRTAELKLAGALAENNIPISFMDTLGPLCKNIFSDSIIAKNTNLDKTKATAILKNVLGNTFIEDVNKKLREKGKFFSLIMDETTDQGNKKQCCFTAIVYDHETSKVDHLFLDMVEVPSGTALGLNECLKQMLRNKNIPIENMVGFSSDTTNVMLGEDCSVFAFLKDVLPYIALIKCSCNMIHLSSSKACLKLPRNVEDLLRSIGAHFSSRSCLQFKEFQEFFQVEIYKILAPAQVSWLSLKTCVDNVLQKYIPLKCYLSESVFSDPSTSTEEILTTMNDRFTLVYLEFMSYVLSLVMDFNAMFQTEISLLHKLKPEVEKLLRTLSANYLEMNYVKSFGEILSADFINSTYFMDLENIYIGVKAAESIENLKKNEDVPRSAFTDFYKSCQAFYIELTSDITKRFDFTDPLFSFISIVSPSEAQQFKIKSLMPVLKRFPVLEKFVTIQKLDNEWRAHAMLDFAKHGLDGDDDAESYWGKVFRHKNGTGQYIFPNLKITISLLLVLPFANASVERKFSELKNIKTENRNSLHTDVVVSLMATREGIKKHGSLKFNPSRNMLTTKTWEKCLNKNKCY